MVNNSSIVVGVILGIFFALVVFWLKKAWWKFKLGWRMTKARWGEHDAARFLETNGYHIVETQKRLPIITYLDGEPFENHVRADYIVSRDGRTYLVEVKTGEEAPRVTNAATRRQLLEYFYAYQPDAILLLDMTNRELKEVSFAKQVAPVEPGFAWRDYSIGFIAGAVFIYIILRF